MKATAKKIEAIKEMFAKYYELEEIGSELNERMFDNGKYNANVHLEWCENYDKECKIEKDIKRNVRALAENLGFVIEKREFSNLICTWKETFDAICAQYEKMLAALHDISYYNLRFINNAE